MRLFQEFCEWWKRDFFLPNLEKLLNCSKSTLYCVWGICTRNLGDSNNDLNCCVKITIYGFALFVEFYVFASIVYLFVVAFAFAISVFLGGFSLFLSAEAIIFSLIIILFSINFFGLFIAITCLCIFEIILINVFGIIITFTIIYELIVFLCNNIVLQIKSIKLIIHKKKIR